MYLKKSKIAIKYLQLISIYYIFVDIMSYFLVWLGEKSIYDSIEN
jgi:hypothetical protein